MGSIDGYVFTTQFSSNKISICLITNLKRVDKHPRSVILTDDGL